MITPIGEPYEPTIAPWLTVKDAQVAADFYRSAFDAVEVYRFEVDGDLAVAQLSVGGAMFWIQGEDGNGSNAPRDGSVRMILSVDDPDAVFNRAIGAGAIAVSPVAEEHGWRTGRITDPFGFDWELSRQLDQPQQTRNA